MNELCSLPAMSHALSYGEEGFDHGKVASYLLEKVFYLYRLWSAGRRLMGEPCRWDMPTDMSSSRQVVISAPL